MLPEMLMHFSDEQYVQDVKSFGWCLVQYSICQVPMSSVKVSVTVSKLGVGFQHKIRCFHLHHGQLCLTYVNVNAPLIHFCGFCEVTLAEEARPVISRFDL